MSDILDEIKQSFNEKKTNKILGRATIAIFAVGIVFISYLGISSWYESRKAEQIQKDGALLIQTVNSINYAKIKDNKNPEERENLKEKNKLNIEKLEKLAEQGSSAYSTLANFYLASLALIDGNHNKAIYYYQRAGKDSDSDTVNEYSKLVEINAKLQFNIGSSEGVLKKIDDTIYMIEHYRQNRQHPAEYREGK